MSGGAPFRGPPAARLEAVAVIASTISACSSLTSVGAVLSLYKAGGSPGTDPVFPKAPSARPEGQRLELNLGPYKHSPTTCEWLRASTQPPPAPGLHSAQPLRSFGREAGWKGWNSTGAVAGAGGQAAGIGRLPEGSLGERREGSGLLQLPQAHLTLRCPCVSRAGGTMRQAGRAALLAALLLLLQLCPGNSQRSPKAAGIQDSSLRWSPGARNQGGGARALLLLLAERFPRRAGSSRWEPGTAGERPRRDNPPLSIDLTFHLLRTLLELARTQSQRERAEQNRIIFDSVGK